MRPTGSILIFIGVLFTAYALLSSGAAPGSTTINLGLMIEKIVCAIVGGTFTISGVILVRA